MAPFYLFRSPLVVNRSVELSRIISSKVQLALYNHYFEKDYSPDGFERGAENVRIFYWRFIQLKSTVSFLFSALYSGKSIVLGICGTAFLGTAFVRAFNPRGQIRGDVTMHDLRGDRLRPKKSGCDTDKSTPPAAFVHGRRYCEDRPALMFLLFHLLVNA